MWYGHKDQAEQYKQYLKDHADEFGLRAEDIDSVERPVLVNMLEVDDTEAINLGQFVAQDTESGGIERIKPKNIMQKMGNDMRSFANLLLASSDEETSFAGLVDANGTNVLKWMMQKGYITPTQYSSAFDSKGNLTAEAKNDLRGIMYQSIFKGGSVRLEEMFNALPVKAQRLFSQRHSGIMTVRMQSVWLRRYRTQSGLIMPCRRTNNLLKQKISKRHE